MNANNARYISNAKERERLACFPDDIPHWDLITYFTLTEQDRSLIDTYQGDTNRLGAALQLCAVRYLGFCPANLHAAPSDMIAFLAGQLHVDPRAFSRLWYAPDDPQCPLQCGVGSSWAFAACRPKSMSRLLDMADGTCART